MNRTDLFQNPRLYFQEVNRLLQKTEATISGGVKYEFLAACNWFTETAYTVKSKNKKIFFIGNGGSASIASHMAIDWSKNGGITSLALNDSCILTALSNDFEYARVFSEQLKWYSSPGDMLVAISSSGKSPNILEAVRTFKNKPGITVTLSGFKKDNPLRVMGDMNFFIPSMEYGFVEIGHLTILHAILDMIIKDNCQ